MTWVRGRELATVTKGSDTISYTYGESGLRISKTVNGVVHEYIYDGDLLISEQFGDTLLIYVYDEAGSPIGFKYRTTGYAIGTFDSYVFEKNLQGDIIAIYNTSGTSVATYKYDAWGNVISATGTMASVNPFRYRGYYYDTETGFYYLQSRYYDPAIGRFINADNIIANVGGNIRGYNVYAYCFNNPINMHDQSGNWPQWLKNTVKWVAKNVIKPIAKTAKEVLSTVDVTYSKGINVSGSPSIFSFNAQGGISIDTKGNIAIQWSWAGGFTSGSPSASVTLYQSITNAPNIYKLNGLSYQIGGSMGGCVYGIPLAVNGDINIIPDNDLNTTYGGITTCGGIGTPGGEFHVEWGETNTLDKMHFNIYDVAEQIYIKIMEW